MIRITSRAPDAVFLNGAVITVDERQPRATGVAVRNGKVEAVGDTAEVQQMAGPETQVVDLKGRSLVPGFNESHSHLMTVGRNATLVSLYHCRSIAEVVAALEAAVAEAEPGAWIEGKGWAEAVLAEGRAPTRRDLDPVSPRNPVVLSRIYATDAVNSLALAASGVTASTPNPPGGYIERDADGEPTGVLKENARALVGRAIPPLTLEQLASYVSTGIDAYLEYGITSVLEPGLTPLAMRAYQHVRRQGGLHLRVSMMPDFRDHYYANRHNVIDSMGVMSEFGDDWLQIGPAKLSLDGGLANMTSYQYEPYAKPGSRTVLRIPPQELNEVLFAIHREGWSIGVHATGSRAHEMVVLALAAARQRLPSDHTRHHVVHGYFPTSTALQVMRDHDLVFNAQPVFIYFQGDAYPGIVGDSLAQRYKPLRSVLEAGVRLCINSDVATAASHNPMLGLYAAIRRTTQGGRVLGPDEALTFAEALEAYTLAGAYQTQEDHLKGSITPGKVADLAVLDRDVSTLDPDLLPKVQVDETWVGGARKFLRATPASQEGVNHG